MSEESPSQEVKGAPRRRGRPPKKKLTPEELVLSTEQSSPELAQGYRILQELMKGPHRMFLDPPNNGEKGMSDYHEVIYQPMWLNEMLRKFNSHEYKELSQFAADMRLLLENCYRYFGPNSPRTKRCLKLEQAYQSRVDQLPSELRTQCLLTGADTQPDDHVIESEGFVSALLAGVSDERSARERDRKSRVAEERRTERQGKDKEILQWEDEVLFPGDTREQMKSMWEIPQIGHFVYLALDALNINEISIFELERVFLMPQASHALAMLMTSLLVSPLVRLKLDNMPPMSYRLWSRKLAYKVANWYKVFHKYDSDPIAAMDKLGIEPDSWKVLGAKNPLEEYQFHELSFHQRVWVVKTLCDHILHNQKCVRDRIGTAEVRDAYKYCLGLDRSGLQYLHFPEFCGDDLRVYRQAAQCASLTERDLEHRDTISREEAVARRKTKTKKVMEEEEQSSDEEESLDAPDLSSQQRWWKRRGRKPKKRFVWSRYIKDKQLDDQEGEKAPDSQGDPTPDTDDPASPTPAQEVFLGFSDHLGPLTKERDPLYSPHWLSPNPQDFYMVTECMDTLNQLILTMCDDDVELLHRMNRIKSKSSRPTCEVRLAESLQKLANELSPFELQLITSVKKTRMKLHQEWDEFKQRPADYVDPSEAIWLNQPETQDCLAEDKVDVETGELLEDSLVLGEPMSLEETAPTPPADLTEGEVEGSDGVRVSHSRRAKRKRDIARTRVELQDGTEVPEAELSEDLRQELLGSNDDTDGNEEEDDDDPDDVWELPVKKRKVMPAKPRLPLIAGGPKKSRKKKKVPDPPNESDPSATPLKKCRKKKVTAKNAKSGEPGPVVPTKAVLNVDKEGRIVVPMTTTNPALLALQGKTIAEAMREGKVLKNHGSLVLRPAPPPQMEPTEDFRHSDITIKQEPVEVKEEPAPYPPTTIKLERPEDQNNRLAEEIKPSLNAIIKSGVYKHLPSGTNVIFKIFRREDGRIDLVPLNHELVDAGKIQDVPQLSQILTEYQDKVLSQSPDPGNPAPLDSDTFEPSALSDSLPVAPTPVEPQPVPRVKQEMQPIAILRTVKQEVGKMFDFPMEITSCSSTETTQTLTTQFPAQSLKTEAMFAQSQPHAELSHPQVHLQVVNIERLTAQPSRPQSGLFLTDPRQVKSLLSAMSVLNQSGEEQVECPLCMEPLEVDDLNFFPCTCGYQICRFCWHRIRTDENGLCPACRKAYPENPADFKPLSQEEVSRLKTEKRQRDQQRKQKLTENRKHLSNVRVVQRNLVFVVGLPVRLAEAEVLKKHEYFGKFGKIHKVVINQSTSYAGSQGPSASAYVTYNKADDALRAIQAVNNISVDGRTLKASLGTTKYCSHFMKNQPCPKSDCMYLHDLGDAEASFTKEEMQQGKHQEYEKKLHEQLLNSSNKERKPTPSPPAVALNAATTTPLTNNCTVANPSPQTSQSKEAWPSLNTNLVITTAASTGGFGVTTSTVNIAEPCNSKGEVSSKRQKHEQPSSSSKSSSNHKKRHTSTDENRGRKTKEKYHLTCEDHDKLSRPGAPGQSSGGSGSRTSTSLSEGESSSEVEETARGRLQRAAATLLETDNNSFFSANSFTKVTPTAANSGTSEWLQNGLSLAHMPDVLPPVHSSEDWQAAFGFANSSHGDTSPPRHDPLPELAQSGPPSADDSGQTQQVFNGTGAPLDGVAVPHKFVLARGPAEDYHIQQEHLNHNGVSFRTEVSGGVAANSTNQTRQRMFPAHTSPSFVQDSAVFLLARHPPPQQQYLANGHQHLIHNGLLPSSKFLADFHMRQAHNSQVLHNHPLTPSDGDGYSGGGGLLANGTGVHSKFTREFGAMLENGGGVTGSNHSGAGSKMNGDVSVIGENGVDENYTGFPGNDNCRHNGYLDYGAEPAEDDQITDDLGFDPFHETQKALAEMMEKESIMMQSGQQLQHHNHILPQQYRQHMPTQLSFPPGGSGSKLLSAYTSQQQNHRLSQNMSVSACTKLLDGLGLGQVPSPAPRARLPPPGFPTAPNHMNAFGLGIPRAPSSTGSKILPFMGLGSNPSTNTPNGNPPSPTALYAVAPSYGGLLGSKQPGDAWPDSLRSMLPGVNTGGPTPPPSSQGVMFATHTHTHTQKGWNGVSPCTDWTVLDPAIVSSSRSHNFPPSNTPLHWQDTSTAPLFYAGGAEWGSGSNPAPPPGFSLRQNSAASSVPPPEIENM